MKKYILLLVIVFLVAIQFIKTPKNIELTKQNAHFENVYKVPADVQSILQTACYDCHSNNTIYPKYFVMQPVAMYMNKHIQNGKKHFNFSEFGNYDEQKMKHKLNELVEVIEENEMPLFSYTLLHPNAKISEANKQILSNWLKSLE